MIKKFFGKIKEFFGKVKTKIKEFFTKPEVRTKISKNIDDFKNPVKKCEIHWYVWEHGVPSPEARSKTYRSELSEVSIATIISNDPPNELDFTRITRYGYKKLREKFGEKENYVISEVVLHYRDKVYKYNTKTKKITKEEKRWF